MDAASAEVDSWGNVLVKHKRRKIELRVEDGEQLLPGIPDHVTVAVIVPKLPWTAFHILASVSRGWQQVIQSHEVYDARVRAQSTQKLVLLENNFVQDVKRIALFSLSDGSLHHLPPFRGINRRLPWSCQYIFLDGKLYVLGGEHSSLNVSSGKVYMLDLAGQKKWKQCASMKDARADFGCGVINGQIYVFGGRGSNMDPVYGSEVYDPKADVWSAIAPTVRFGAYHEVITMGEELLVHSGYSRVEKLYGDQDTGHSIGEGPYAEVYHPLKNQWRIVDHFVENLSDILLMVGGKLHRVTSPWLGIDVYDTTEKSWKRSQRFSFSAFGPANSLRIRLLDVVAMDGELLALLHWTKLGGRFDCAAEGICLMRSKGLGCQDEEIVWQETCCSRYSSIMFCDPHPRLSAIIQL